MAKTITSKLEDFSIQLEEKEGRYTVTIDSYKGNAEKVIVPDNIGGLPVTVIGGLAFFNCDTLTSVILPEGIVAVESGAFGHCINLVDINLPQSLVSIGYAIFEDCEKLTSIRIAIF